MTILTQIQIIMAVVYLAYLFLPNNVLPPLLVSLDPDPPLRGVPPLPEHHLPPVPLLAGRLEMYEHIVIKLPIKWDRSPMGQSSRLIPQHLARLQVDFVCLSGIVFDEERP